eukprot:6481721-Prymnesium_polylepis.2
MAAVVALALSATALVLTRPIRWTSFAQTFAQPTLVVDCTHSEAPQAVVYNSNSRRRSCIPTLPML